jgi:hypothetical protein
LFHHAFAARGASGEFDAIGAHRVRRSIGLLGILALMLVASTLAASPANAETTAGNVTVSNILGGSAHVTGEANSEFYEWSFQISTDGGDWNSVPAGGINGGVKNFSTDLTNLNASTKYLVRLVVVSLLGDGTAFSDPVEFETLPVAKPTVLSVDDATAVFSTTAEVSGSVERPVSTDPAFNARCDFEYVTDAAFQPKNEEQSLTVRASGGTFNLSFEGQTTSPLPFDASAGTLEEALEGLPSIGSGSANVSGGPGDQAGTAPYTIIFTGPLAAKDVELIGADPSGLTVEGEPGAEVQVLAEGHPEGFNNPGAAPCKPSPVTADGQTPVATRLSGLAPSTTYHLRLRATNAGGTDFMDAASTFTTKDLPVLFPPTVLSADGAREITTTTAKIAGSVERPAGDDPVFDAACTVEYIADQQFAENENNGLPGFEGASQTPCDPDPVSDPGATPVDASLTGLTTGTVYHVRITASNSGGADSLEAPSFKTASAVLAQTTGLRAIHSTSATVAGRINPDNADINYQFEWGKVEGPDDESYESVVPSVAEPLGSSDKVFHSVVAPLGDLSPGIAYHYRVVATNVESGEVTLGLDRSFTTPNTPKSEPCPNQVSRVGASAALPDCRVYEWATPGLNQANVSLIKTGVRSDGAAIWFESLNAPLDAEGAYLFGRIAAIRGPNGWTTRGLSGAIPTTQGNFEFETTETTLVSSNVSETVVQSNLPLAGVNSPEGVSFYVRHADGSYESLQKNGSDTQYGSVRGASADFTHIFYAPSARQLPADPLPSQSGLAGNAYEWNEGDLRLVGILPGESSTPAPLGATVPRSQGISDDGRMALFTEGTPSTPSDNPSLYLRKDGKSTVEVSASRRTEGPDDPNPIDRALPIGVSPDGSTVLFTSKSPLTNDANTGSTADVPNHLGANLYAYEVDNDILTDLTVATGNADEEKGADVQDVLGFSRDGSYVYFTAKAQLAPGAQSGQINLYVAHHGQIDYIGIDPLVRPDTDTFELTSDGRTAVFLSRVAVTGYNNVPDEQSDCDVTTNGQNVLGCPEMFKYSVDTGQVECVSCRASGDPPTVGTYSVGQNAISAYGRRVFFQTRDAIVSGATNGLMNVYEYQDGEVTLLTNGDGDYRAEFFGASLSGDDVFIRSRDELTATGAGPVSAVYDARVNAEVPQGEKKGGCQGESCRGPGSKKMELAPISSAQLEGRPRLTGPPSKVVKGRRMSLRLAVPSSGELVLHGRGLQRATARTVSAGTVSIDLRLEKWADRMRRRDGVFRTKVSVLLRPKTEEPSRLVISLAFKGPTKKGGK